MSYIQFSEANCRNCLRCVRVCPTKAMTYQNHQPTIIEEECILCGKCYAICPHSAKKVHSDIEAVRQWIREGQPLALSIAPSFASVWPDYPQLKRR
ncbi:MAG: 4Fe-4S binding protein [Holdemania massiliensis]